MSNMNECESLLKSSYIILKEGLALKNDMSDMATTTTTTATVCLLNFVDSFDTFYTIINTTLEAAAIWWPKAMNCLNISRASLSKKEVLLLHNEVSYYGVCCSYVYIYNKYFLILYYLLNIGTNITNSNTSNEYAF
jgi:hypothetical protein